MTLELGLLHIGVQQYVRSGLAAALCSTNGPQSAACADLTWILPVCTPGALHEALHVVVAELAPAALRDAHTCMQSVSLARVVAGLVLAALDQQQQQQDAADSPASSEAADPPAKRVCAPPLLHAMMEALLESFLDQLTAPVVTPATACVCPLPINPSFFESLFPRSFLYLTSRFLHLLSLPPPKKNNFNNIN